MLLGRKDLQTAAVPAALAVKEGSWGKEAEAWTRLGSAAGSRPRVPSLALGCGFSDPFLCCEDRLIPWREVPAVTPAVRSQKVTGQITGKKVFCNLLPYEHRTDQVRQTHRLLS